MLRTCGWGFKKKGKRNELWKKRGSPDRISVPTNKHLPEAHVRIILGQAGCSNAEIDDFLRAAIKS